MQGLRNSKGMTIMCLQLKHINETQLFTIHLELCVMFLCKYIIVYTILHW